MKSAYNVYTIGFTSFFLYWFQEDGSRQLLRIG